MKRQISLDEDEPIAAGSRVAHRLKRCIECRDGTLPSVADDQSGGATFQRSSDFVDLPDVVFGQGGHRHAPLGLVADEPFRTKGGQRLADRAPTDLQLSGDFGLDEAGPGWQRAVQNALSEQFSGRRRECSQLERPEPLKHVRHLAPHMLLTVDC